LGVGFGYETLDAEVGEVLDGADSSGKGLEERDGL